MAGKKARARAGKENKRKQHYDRGPARKEFNKKRRWRKELRLATNKVAQVRRRLEREVVSPHVAALQIKRLEAHIKRLQGSKPT